MRERSAGAPIRTRPTSRPRARRATYAASASLRGFVYVRKPCLFCEIYLCSAHAAPGRLPTSPRPEASATPGTSPSITTHSCTRVGDGVKHGVRVLECIYATYMFAVRPLSPPAPNHCPSPTILKPRPTTLPYLRILSPASRTGLAPRPAPPRPRPRTAPLGRLSLTGGEDSVDELAEWHGMFTP